MKNNISCPNCSSTIDIQDDMCPVCNKPITDLRPFKSIELCIVRPETDDVSQHIIVSDLRMGESVIINNMEHPYYQEIALVCGIKHKHVRLEVNGIRIWMPNEWVDRHV